MSSILDMICLKLWELIREIKEISVKIAEAVVKNEKVNYMSKVKWVTHSVPKML